MKGAALAAPFLCYDVSMEHLRSNESLASRDTFETEDEERLVTETRELLNSLDEEVLRDIFERELKLSGVESPHSKVAACFVPFRNAVIDGSYDGDTLGTFSTQKGIRLHPRMISKNGQFHAKVKTMLQVNSICGKWGVKKLLRTHEVVQK
jgi:hypothetical protein